MLRRTRLRFAVNLVDIMNTAAFKTQHPHDRISKAEALKPKIERGSGDPFHNERVMDTLLRGSRFKDEPDPMRNADPQDLKKWMEVSHAATILKLSKDHLIRLKPKEVADALDAVLPQLQTRFARREAHVAAELLMDYIESKFHHDTTVDHYRKMIHNAAMEVEDTLRQDREDKKQTAMRLGGVAMFGTFLFFGFGSFIMFRFFGGDDAKRIFGVCKDVIYGTILMPQPIEPAPNYQTRYAQTPPEMEVFRRDMGDAVTRTERAAEKYVEEVVRSDEAYLTELYNHNQRELKEEKAKAPASGPKSTLQATEEVMAATLHNFPSPLQRMAIRVEEGEAKLTAVEQLARQEALDDDEKIL